MTNNYFKVISPGVKASIVFFDGDVELETRGAFKHACEVAFAIDGSRVVMWAAPKMAGPWDICGLVGHRAEPSIQKEMDERVARLADIDPNGFEAALIRGEMNRLAYELGQRRAIFAERERSAA